MTNVDDAAPVAMTNAYAAVEGTVVSRGSVLANDSDVDTPHTSLFVAQVATNSGSSAVSVNGTNTVTTSLGGTVIMNADGTFTYVAPARSHADAISDVDSFVYRASDGTNSSAWTTVTVSISDSTPSAINDSDTVAFNASVSGNLLANDAAVDVPKVMDSVTFNGVTKTFSASTVVFDTPNGLLTVGTDGSYTYQSQVTDSKSVGEVNVATFATFEANSDLYGFRNNNNTWKNADGSLNLSGLTATAQADVGWRNAGGGNPAGLVVGASTGLVDAGEHLVINLLETTHQASIGLSRVSASLANVSWKAYDEVGTLVASGDFSGATSAQGMSVKNLFSATPYKYLVLGSEVSNGFAVAQVIFDRNPANYGESFDYTMKDADGSVAAAHLTISVGDATNTPPVAVNDAPTSLVEDAAGNTRSGSVLANDTDANNDALSVISVALGTTAGTVGSSLSGTYGTLLLNSNGSYTYTLDNNRWQTQNLVAGETKTEVFNYTISDGRGGYSNATLTITIEGAQDTTAKPPTIVNVTATGLNAEYYGYNDSDPDGSFAHTDDRTATFGGNSSNLNSVEDLERIINGRNTAVGGGNIVGTEISALTGAADVRFTAKKVDYLMNGDDLGQNNSIAAGNAVAAGTGRLADFLDNSGDRASAVTEFGLGDTTDAAMRLSGKIFFERGNYDFRVRADDGFRLKVAGETLIEFDGNQAPTTRVFRNVEIDDIREGLQPFELLYWEQGGNAVLKIEYKLSSDSTWKVLSTDNIALFTNESAPTIEDRRVQDLVASGGGAFQLRAGSVLDGGSGGDTLTGQSARDLLQGNAGNDSLIGMAGADYLDGGAGNDTLYGDDVAGTLTGNDILDGGTGADAMYGGKGDDIYYIDNAGDTVNELASGGTDTVRLAASYNPGSYTLGANVENLTILGSGDTAGTGNASNNRLLGGDGNNTLSGGAGEDYLAGGKGADALWGGTNGDTFAWSLADRGAPGAPVTDVIKDFQTGSYSNVDGATPLGDRLDLRDLLDGEHSTRVDASQTPDIGNLLNYLDFEKQSVSGTTNTVIHVSTTGQFNGTNTAAVEDQKIVLEGVDLLGSGTDTEVLRSLLQNGKLIVD
ncbi:MAG: type I secretion C-terminal target domain-containing protein [Rhodocyclaceae bacterium]|nr:type I secretion C-terminal target domain-containing protein [Rhodocyclaceae bacterium]